MALSTPASLPAGSRRFWVTVLCFALANAGAWVGYDRLRLYRNHAHLEVQQSAPGNNTLVGGRPVFWWTFNLDVTPPAGSEPPPALVSPQVSGRWSWDNARTLTFKPDAPLPKATPLTVSLLPERLHTPDGFRLEKPFVTSVHTTPLEVRGVRQAAFDDRDQLVVEIEFNDEVIPDEVMNHLTIRSDEGKPVAFRPHGEAIGRVLRVTTDPVPSTAPGHAQARVKVALAPGFCGRSGPLGLERTYECEVPVGSDLIATEARSFFADRDETVLLLQFNNPVDVATLKPLLSVQPAVPFTVSSGYEGVELHGAFEPATRYAIKIAKAPAGVPHSPRQDTLSVYVPDHAPSLWFEHEEGYLGSAGNRTLLAHAINASNIRLTLTRIYDNNLVDWRNIRAGAESYDRPVVTKDLRLPPLKNKRQDIRLSLDELLPAGAQRDGVYLARLESTSGVPASTDEESDYRGYGRRQATSLVTLSDIGLTAKQGRTAVTVWATSLRTAEPLAHVRLRLYSDKNQYLGDATTSENGLASIVPVGMATGETASVIVADRPAADASFTPAGGAASAGRDLTWLDLRTGRVNFGESDTTGAAYVRGGHEAFIYTDRGVYRPGETVHFRAIVRGPEGVTPDSFPVRWQFRRPDLHNWKSFQGRIDSDGAVSLELPLPNDLPTGHWSVRLGLPGGNPDAEAFGTGEFQVEDFMPNRMQVGLTLDGTTDKDNPSRFLVKDQPVAARVQADYLFGKPVTERPARVVARLDPTRFAPAKWENWTFGDSANTAEVLDGLKNIGRRSEIPEQTLDDHGRASFDLDLQSLLAGESQPVGPAHPRVRRNRRPAPDPATAPSTGQYVGPWRLTVTASVIETGGRAVSASRQADLDPVGNYIGVRSVSASDDSGSRFEIARVSTGGERSTEDAILEADVYRENWNNSLEYESGRYVYHSTRLLEPVREKIEVRLVNGVSTLDVLPPSMGGYVLRVRDRQTGFVTSLAFYAGRGAWQDSVSRENPEKLELLVQPLPRAAELFHAIRDLDPTAALSALRSMTSAGGETGSAIRQGEFARVIVRSPFAGRLLLSVETDDVVSTRVIDMPASSFSVPVRLTGNCRPNAYVTATVVRPVDPDATWQTHRAVGSIRVPVDNSDRKLDVRLESPQQIRPTQSMAVVVRVTGWDGTPAPDAAVTVAAVDEGICQLTGFTTPDPFKFFTRERALGVGTADLFGQLMPEVAKLGGISAVGGDKDAYDPRHGSPVSARRVKPVSLVSQVLHTDSQGFARAEFTTPQFTGKLRLMAVASSGPASGAGEGAVLVRSPLLVQSSWPLFAAPGDTFQVPLVVFNNTPVAGEASVRIRVNDGPLRVGANAGAALPGILLPANGQATRMAEVTASNVCGVSHVSLVASMGDETYEEDVELPVRPACPEISLGGYAVAAPDRPAQIVFPGGMLKGTAHFQLKATRWPLLQIPQGLDYLERYPYGCLEQTTSTLLPLVYLSDIGAQIAPGVFEKDRVSDKVQVGITRLIGMQTAAGGLAMWPGYRDAWPWGSVYAAHFLIEAQNAGHPVPADFRESLLAYTRNLLNASSDDPGVVETQAYACYVLAMAGKPERAVMSRLAEIANSPRPDGEMLPGQARLHLAAAWLASGRRDLAEGLIPQVLPSPRQSRSLSGSLGSPVRDRAILIDTLLAVRPDHPALPDLVQQLADAGRHGQWRSTQDTAFAMLALGRYLRQSKPASPYDSADLQYNGHHLNGVTEGKPLLWDADDATANFPAQGETLLVQVSGPANAKANISWIQTGIPLTPPKAANNGMTLRRRLLDEHGKPLKANRVQSGDLVQVELTLSSETPLEYVAIDDLLPAGLEIENPRLATTADTTDGPGQAARPNHFVDSRLDMRDDRLILIGNLIGAGSGTYVYTARAVTPGRYVLPPAHAECMYDTATNSLGDGGTLEVLPAGSPRVADVKD